MRIKKNHIGRANQHIDEITKYRLSPNLKVDGKETDVELNLVKLYSKHFNTSYEYDDTNYPDFDKVQLPNIIENVISNFTDFGIYHEILNFHEYSERSDNAMG